MAEPKIIVGSLGKEWREVQVGIYAPTAAVVRLERQSAAKTSTTTPPPRQQAKLLIAR